MEVRIVKTERSPRLLAADDFDDIAEIRSRYEPAPRDFLKVMSVSEEPTKTPVLVCSRCHRWCRHEADGLDPIVTESGIPAGMREMYACTGCGFRRAWGSRNFASSRGNRCLN